MISETGSSMAEREKVIVFEVAQLEGWTTGYSEEHAAVALILRNADGVEFGVVMPPAEAMTMGDQLSKLGLEFTPAKASA